MRYSLTAAILVASISLCGCADNSVGKFRVGSAYSIKGKTYFPQESYTKEQTGIVSWYGPGFDGKKTANGERFDEDAFTAAHPTLQMPSLVRVTNLENGRTLVVRVNDRGPFHSNRIMDLSKGAAKQLGVIATGTANVRIQVLSAESMALAEAAKRGIDTKGAEIAMNETGHLDERFASFYPSFAKRPQADVMVASDGYQPNLPAGALAQAQTLAVPVAPVETASVDTITIDRSSADPVASVIAAAQAEPASGPDIQSMPLPAAAPVQKLPAQHRAAIFQMAPVAEANASEMSGIPPVALASEDMHPNYLPSKPKFLGMRPVMDGK